MDKDPWTKTLKVSKNLQGLFRQGRRIIGSWTRYTTGAVGVAVAVAVSPASAVGVLVASTVGVAVGSLVGVSVASAVGVPVGSSVAVDVGVGLPSAGASLICCDVVWPPTT